MKRLFLLIVLINIFHICTFSDAFDLVPFNSWPYYSLHDLERKGYIYISEDSPVKASTPATRIDFAKELVSFFKELEDPNDIREFSEKDLIKIMRLIESFHDELEFLGINTLKIKTNYGLDDVLHPLTKRQETGNSRTVNRETESRRSKDKNQKQRKYHTKAQAMFENFIADFSLGSYESTSRVKVNYNVSSKDIHGEFVFEAGIDREKSKVEDAPIVKKIVYENNNFPFIDNMKIGRFNLNTGNGILLDNSSNNGIILNKENISLYMFKEDIDARKLPKASGSIISDGLNSFGVKYTANDWLELFYFSIDDIDMNSNGIKDNKAKPVVMSMKKKIAGVYTALDIGFYNYDYTLPTVGMFDTTYNAFDLTLKRFFGTYLSTVKIIQREKGFTPIIDSNDFYYGTDLGKPIYSDLGFNGNVSDFFIKLEKDDLALVIENMSQETGNAEADVVSLIYNKRIKNRFLFESSISSLTLTDPSGILGTVYPDIRVGSKKGITNNIDSTLLRLSIVYDF